MFGCTGALTARFVVQPFIPSGHTQGPTYILAERAAHLVKADLKK